MPVRNADGLAPKQRSRPVTEKRRDQNRRSQKAYRERMKKRFEDLEEQIAFGPTKDIGSVALHPPTVRTVSEAEGGACVNVKEKETSIVIDLKDAFQAAGDLCLPDDTSLSVMDIVIRPHPKAATFPRRHWLPYDAEHTPPPSTSTSTSTSLPPSTRHSPTTSELHAHHQRSPTPITRTSSIPPWADPHQNHLRLTGENCFLATLAIAASIGITYDSYITDQPSPFYLPNTYQSTDSYRPLAQIKRDLRPIIVQHTTPHPSYIDCIIFPTMREKAILLGDRGELDHMTLFSDLLNDGLVCWGSAHQRGMENGVAWTMRSWEARPWFLKKWWFLVGAEDEEVWENSRWWWSMRGERVEETYK